MTSQPQELTMEWQGIELSVTYVPDWCGLGHTAWLEIRSRPERTPLPITETGYRSHFHPCGLVEAAGGLEIAMRDWLDRESRTAGWQRQQEEVRQMSLF